MLYKIVGVDTRTPEQRREILVEAEDEPMARAKAAEANIDPSRGAVIALPPTGSGPHRLMRCKCHFTFGDVAGHALTWVLLAVVTVGLALLCYPYYFARFILQHTTWWED